jgi:hypothetical protein
LADVRPLPELARFDGVLEPARLDAVFVLGIQQNL